MLHKIVSGTIVVLFAMSILAFPFESQLARAGVSSNGSIGQAPYSEAGKYDSTEVSGIIAQNTTWTTDASPYIVVEDIWVLPGVFLNIQPGVIVRFVTEKGFLVDGHLIAEGNSTSNIIFTSNSTSPVAGDWSGISIRGPPPQKLSWSTVEYPTGVGGSIDILKCLFISSGGVSSSNLNITASVFRRAGIEGGGIVRDCHFEDVDGLAATGNNLIIMNCSFTRNVNAILGSGVIQDCQIYNNTNGIGIYGWGSANKISGCQVKDNKGTGIYAHEDSHPLIENTNVTGNGGDGISGGYGWSTIRNCIVSNNSGNGISAGCSVFDSEIANNGGQAVTMVRGALSNCNVTGNLGGGVTVLDPQGGGLITVDHSTISDNLLGINFRTDAADTGSGLSVSNCKISNNTDGGIVVKSVVHRGGWSLTITDTVIDGNGMYGVKTNTTSDSEGNYYPLYVPSSIINSVISNHTIGARVSGTVNGSQIVGNAIGIHGPLGSISNSSVCNNFQIGLDITGGTLCWNNISDNGLYNVRTNATFGTIVNATNNWWGTTNEIQIDSKIYDYYDNNNLALVLYKPYLTGPVLTSRKLTVTSVHDSPRPGNGVHYYDVGSLVTCNVTSSVTEGNSIWTCTGWSGTGSVPSEGTTSSVTFAMTDDSTITWNWHITSFVDDFESGNFAAWDGVSLSPGETAIATTLPHHGTYDARFASNGTGGIEYSYCYKNIGPSSEPYVRAYFYVSTSGIAKEGDRICLVQLNAGGTNTNVAYVGWRNVSGVVKWYLSIRNGSSLLYADSASTPTLNTWYCVELHWKEDAVNGQGDLWIDGVSTCSILGKNTALYGDVTTARVGLAATYNCGSTTVYCDCARTATEYIGPEPSVSFADGFESGNFGAWTGTSVTSGETATVGNSTGHHGSYSGMFTSNGNGGTERAYCYKTITSSTELYARSYFKVATSGIADNTDRFFPIIFRAGENSVAFAGWQKTGGVVKWNLIIRNGTGWVNVFSSATPALNQWYCVELHWKKDAVVGLGELWVDGVKVCSASGRNTANYGDANQVDVGLPETINCASTQSYTDCTVISASPIGTEAGPVQVNVHLESAQDSGATSNLGNMTLDAVSYVLPNDASKTLASFSVAYIAAGAYLFDHWETSGGVSIANAISQTTTVTVSGAGTLRAVYKTPASSTIFEDGFESGNFSAWLNPNLTAGETRNVVSTMVHSGGYAGLFVSDGSGGTERAYVYKIVSPVGELYARAYLRVAASGIADNTDRFFPIIFKAGSTSVAFAGWQRTGGVVKWNLIIRNGTGWVNVFSSATPALNQWYCVELHWKKDAAAGLGELWVDGALICSASGRNTTYFGDANRVDIGLAEIVNCASTQAYVDCTVFSAAYIGLESAAPAPVFADDFESGSFSAWTASSSTVGETANVVGTVVHDGVYAGRFASNGNGGTERAYCYKIISAQTELYVSGSFRVAASGLVEEGDRFYMVAVRSSSGVVAFAGWRVTGGVVKWNLVVRDGTGWVNVYSSVSPVLNQWYDIQLHWKSDAINGLGELYVNGVLVCSSTGKNTANYGSATRVDFGLPELVNCGATEVYGDTCKVSVNLT